MRKAFLWDFNLWDKGVSMSEEELVKSVFEMHKAWIENGLANAKDMAHDCNIDATLRQFYRATLALKGLESVFTVEIPEVRQYIDRKKDEIPRKEIPEIANIFKTKCLIRRV